MTKSGEPAVSVTRTLETTPDELARGFLFAGRYEIIEELGAGGMGKVYRAFDKKLQEEIALKMIRPEIGIDKRTVERFHNEIKVARKIGHKNVCRVHDLHEEGGTLYLTMEYVRGEDLKSLIKRTRALTIGTAVSIVRQVGEGLAEAHNLGIVHRDLKPGNIMIDKEGNAKIMDFGIARSLLGKGLTGEGAMIGTPEYMSPEQVEGKEADRRSDIYALGVILFEMIVGRAPFEGDTPFSIANKHKSEPPPIPKKLVPQIPEGLNKLILRCLEKDKAKRYQTAEELLSDIETIEQSLPTADRITSKRKTITHREVTVKFTPKKILIPIAAVLILAVASFFVWRNVIHRPLPPLPSARPTLAVLYFKNNSGDPALDYWKENLPILLTTGLSQSRYLRVLDDPVVYGILKKLGLSNSEKYTPEDLKNIAAEGGATHLLSGNYLIAGGKFIVNLSLIDAKTGAVLNPIQEEAPNNDAILSSVDSLVKKVKVALNIPQQAVEDATYKMVGDVYTRNPKALEYYFEGARLRNSLDYYKSVEALEKAVELDPDFAMAYRMLGIIYGNFQDFFKQYQYLHKAYELRDRLPEKDRLLVEGEWFMFREETRPKAYDVYKKVVERYPDDLEGRSRLAFAAKDIDIDESIREWEFLLNTQNQTKSGVLYNNLSWAYCMKEDYKKAREHFEEMLKVVPTVPDVVGPVTPTAWRHIILAQLFLLEKNFDAAVREHEKAAALAPNNLQLKAWIVFIDSSRENPDKALETLGNLLKGEKDPLMLDDFRFLFFMMKGKFREALDIADKAEKKAISEGAGNEQLFGLLMSSGKSFLQTGHADRALKKFREGLECIKKEESSLPVFGQVDLIQERRLSMLWQICALCDLGRVEDAEALYGEFERLIPNYLRKDPNYDFSANAAFPAGKIEFAKKDAPAAIKELEESLQKMGGENPLANTDHAYLLDMLGDAYQLGGRLDKAAEAFAHIRELQNGRWDWSAVYSRSFYKLGKVYEQMGKKEEARKEFSKFLDLWKDADPGLPEVADARKRLAGL